MIVTLINLSIGCESYDNIDIKHFFAMMTNNKYIKNLGIKNMINDATIDEFIEMITTNNIIEELSICDDDISDENLQQIFIALEKNTMITKFYLVGIIKEFPKNFNNTTLKELYIDIEIVDTIVDYLEYNPNLTSLELRSRSNISPQRFFHSLENNCTLEKLVLRGFHADELISMENVFKLNKNLKVFKYSWYDINNDVVSKIVNALEFNNSLEEIYLSPTDKSFAITEFKKILETNYTLKYIDGCMDELGHLLTLETKAKKTKFLRTKKSVG